MTESLTHEEYTPIRVHVTNPQDGKAKRCRRALRTNTYTLTSTQPVQIILPQADTRVEAYITSAVSSSATVVSPSVPATTVAQQNTNNFPVQVVITAAGATITNVSVNGVTVGTAAGTYTVPAFGAISIAFTGGPPTWVWSAAAPPAAIVYISSSQAAVMGLSNGSTQISGSDTMPFPVSTTDQVWASAATAALPVTLSVVAIYEEYE